MQKELSAPTTSLLLVCALTCLLLGRIFQLPILLFIFPVFAIRYLRRVSLLPGFLLLLTGTVAVILMAFWGIASHMFSSATVFAVVMTVSTLVGLLPILLDAWLFKKGVSQQWLIAIYPGSKVLLEYLGSANSPFGIWGSPVSMLAGWQPFNNIVAYGGIWTLSLLAALFSSLLVYILENGLRHNPVSKILLRWYVLLILIIAAVGMFRIKAYQPGATVRVAVVLANDSLRNDPVNKMYRHLLERKEQPISTGETTFFHRAFDVSNQDLLQEINKAAAAGAKIIFCAEGNMVTMKEDEKALIDTTGKIAEKWGVYIGMAVEVYSPTAIRPVENKVVFIKPDGRIAFEYKKHFPIGVEEELMQVGDGNIPTCNTPYGKIAAIICFDTDNIRYVRKAAGADILFAPSNDWEAIAALRGKITRYRALEDGFILIRPTSHGVTEMVTPIGQLVYANNYFNHPLRLMLADIPTKKLATVYAQTGDGLPLLVMLALLILLTGCGGFVKRKMGSRSIAALVLIVFFMPCNMHAQNTNSDSIRLLQQQPAGKSRTVLFPALSYAPETSLALGLTLMHFYESSVDARQSQISANSLYTFNGQFINEAGLVHYTQNNNYLVKGALICNKYPEKFYGIGNKTSDENAIIITYNMIKADASLLKRIKKYTYTGIRYNYANYFNVHQKVAANAVIDTLNGGRGNVQSGLGLALLYDSRDNSTNCSTGWFALVEATWNNTVIGSGTNYFAFDADVRKYHSLRTGSVLAFQGVVKIKEGNVPFSQLSYLGGGNIMRGFYAGRFRDRDLLAFQGEYRRHLWHNWGLVLFAGAGKVGRELSDLNGSDLQRSLGFGFRRSINKQHKVNLRIDVGFGNNQCNLYVNIGEAF
jgi:apolipoprotein N-acyltransferase